VRPSAGSVRVLGLSPRDDAAALLPRVGFVTQEHPLYRRLTVRETMTLGRKLNPRWDDALAGARIERLELPSDQKVGRLSGGQQAQVALTLALAKRPELLLLDEPVASLDPLARREFLQSVMEAVAEHGVTVVNSPGLVDSGYRGELKVILLNTDREQTFVVEPGMRIAQLVVVPVATPQPIEVAELPATERGEKGFGSSKS